MALRAAPRLWRNPSSGYWYAVWTELGEKRRRSLRTKSRPAAARALREFAADVAAGWSERPDLPLQDGLRLWLEDRERPDRKLATSTLNQYRGVVRQLARVTSPQLLADEVRPLDVRAIMDRVAEQYSATPETVRKKLGVLSMAFRWMVRQELVRRNPCDAVEPPASRPQRKPALTEEVYGRLCAALEEDVAQAGDTYTRRNREALRDLVEVLWRSGLRRVEALRLEWPDIDLESAAWVIRSPRNKGGERQAPIHSALLPLLRRRQLLGEAGPFVPRRPLENAWVSFKKRVPEWRGTDLHSLRHAFVTRLRRSGGADAAQFLAGHRTAAMTDHYTHFNAEDFRGVLERL